MQGHAPIKGATIPGQKSSPKVCILRTGTHSGPLTKFLVSGRPQCPYMESVEMRLDDLEIQTRRSGRLHYQSKIRPQSATYEGSATPRGDATTDALAGERDNAACHLRCFSRSKSIEENPLFLLTKAFRKMFLTQTFNSDS